MKSFLFRILSWPFRWWIRRRVWKQISSYSERDVQSTFDLMEKWREDVCREVGVRGLREQGESVLGGMALNYELCQRLGELQAQMVRRYLKDEGEMSDKPGPVKIDFCADMDLGNGESKQVENEIVRCFFCGRVVESGFYAGSHQNLYFDPRDEWNKQGENFVKVCFGCRSKLQKGDVLKSVDGRHWEYVWGEVFMDNGEAKVIATIHGMESVPPIKIQYLRERKK